MRNLASFSTSLEFEPSAFGNAARYLKFETNMGCRLQRQSLEFGAHTPKIGRRKRVTLSKTQPRVIRFRSSFVQSLNT